MNKKRLISLSLAATLAVSGLAGFTQTAEATSDTDFDAVIAELKAEHSAAEGEMADLEAAVAKNEEETAAALAKIDTSKEALAKLEEEIDTLTETIEKRGEKLKDQVRAVQVVGDSSSVVDFVLQAESFSDLLSRLDTVSVLISSNQRMIDKQNDDKASLVEKEDETKAEQEELMRVAASLEAKKGELELKKAEQAALLASIAADKASSESERDALRNTQREAEAVASNASAGNSGQSTQATTASSSVSSSAGSSSSGSSSSAPKASANGGSIVGNAHAYSGVPYVWGGTSPSGFDCSGFTSYVYAQSGISIPRTAGSQMGASTVISQGQAKAGDLVFFNQTGSIDHVGIYLGGGMFIGAQTSTGVAVASVNSGYWSSYVAGFGRY